MRFTRFPILLILVIFLLMPGGCCECESEGPCEISGTVTDLGSSQVYDGGIYIMFIDVDPDPYNDNHLKAFVGTFTGSQIQYSVDISDVPEGTYYLHMTMDLGAGDFHVGYYGASPDPWDVPGEPNAEIKCGAVLDFNIYD
jgi:hypothetical protein